MMIQDDFYIKPAPVSDFEAEKITRPLYLKLIKETDKTQVLQQLLEVCANDAPKLQSHAIALLLLFCKTNPNHIQFVMNGFLARLEYSKNVSVLIESIGSLELLRLDFKLPAMIEHPFVVILDTVFDSFGDVLDQINRYFLGSNSNDILLRNLNSLKYFIRKSLVSPNHDPSHMPFKLCLLDCFIQFNQKSKIPVCRDLCKLLQFLKIEDENEIKSGFLIMSKMLVAAIKEEDVDAIFMLAPQLLVFCHKHFSWSCINLVHQSLDLNPSDDVIILLLCQLLSLLLKITSSQSGIVLPLVEKILALPKNNYSSIILIPGLMRIISVSLDDHALSVNTMSLVKLIFENMSLPHDNIDIELINYLEILNFDPSVASHLILWKAIFKSLQSPDSAILPDNFRTGQLYRHNAFPLLVSSLLTCKSVHVLDGVLEELNLFLKEDKSVGHYLLLIIICLIQHTKDAAFKHKLLHFVPKLGCVKELVGPVLQIILSFTSNPDLKYDGILMLFELWREEKRCFSYLHKMLLAETNQLAYQLVIAQIIRKVCQLCDNSESTELLPVISSLLNNSSPHGNIHLCKLMLDSIYHLCVHQIIDFQKAWKGIAPKISKDDREDVIAWTCRFFSLLPKNCSDIDDPFVEEVLEALWGYTLNKNLIIVKAAYEGLSDFPPEFQRLRCIPNSLKIHVKYPKDLTAILEGNEGQTIEQVLDYVPGVVYSTMLCRIPEKNLPYFEILLRKLISWELESMPRGIYQSAYQKSRVAKVIEPPNMNYLPHKSVLKDCVVFLKSEAKQPNRNTVVITLLEILSSTPGRLPPFDWTILSPFLKDPTVCTVFVGLLMKMLDYSPTARQCIQELIQVDGTIQSDVEDVILSHIDKLIPNLPLTLVRSVLTLSIGRCLTVSDSGQLFNTISKCIERLDGERLTMLYQLFQEHSTLSRSSCELVRRSFYQCVAQLPEEYFVSFTALSQENLEASLHHRMAAMENLKEHKMDVFKDVIDFVLDQNCDPSPLLNAIFDVCHGVLSEEERIHWILAVLHQIQIIQKKKSEKDLYLMLDVFTTSLIGSTAVLEQYRNDKRELKKLIVLALSILCGRQHWICYKDKIFRWLLTLVYSPSSLPQPFREAIVRSFVLFRHCSDFQNPKYWRKIFREIL